VEDKNKYVKHKCKVCGEEFYVLASMLNNRQKGGKMNNTEVKGTIIQWVITLVVIWAILIITFACGVWYGAFIISQKDKQIFIENYFTTDKFNTLSNKIK